jgi:hypothetical protein
MQRFYTAVRASTRCCLLVALLVVQPTARGDEPAAMADEGSQQAAAPGAAVLAGEIETAPADPCDVGRALAGLTPCLAGDEECAAARLWERRFGPPRPVPGRAGLQPFAVCPASRTAASAGASRPDR